MQAIPPVRPWRQTVPAAVAALVLVVALALALVFGLRGGTRLGINPSLAAILLAPEAPPPPPPPSRPARDAAAPRRPAGRAAAAPAPPPPAIAIALPIAAPPVPLPAAGTVALGQSGAGAGMAGNGPGGGGTGGSGSAGSGSGDGSGGIASAAVQVAGKLSAHDLPHDVLPPGGSLSVGVAYTIGADGRVHDCTVPLSSGWPQVDALVCRLLTARFRYRPARDAAGNPVPSPLRETHSWARRPDPAASAG